MNKASKFQKLDCVILPKISEKPRLTKISRISSMVSCSGCVLAAKIEDTSASTSIAPLDDILVSRESAASAKEIFFNFSDVCII